MSSQGPVLGSDDRAFGLIETFRWSREAGYHYRDEHMARLEHSARSLGFVYRQDLVERRLAAFAADIAGASARVRLILSKGASLDVSSSPLSAPSTASCRVAIAGSAHRAADPWLRHKTTMRDRYEQPLAAAVASVQADEVLFLNEHGNVCEGARSNVFVEREGQLLTPPLACGLLPGALRAHLIRNGKAREAVLRLADLAGATEWFMGNSVRGLVKATLMSAS